MTSSSNPREPRNSDEAIARMQQQMQWAAAPSSQQEIQTLQSEIYATDEEHAYVIATLREKLQFFINAANMAQNEHDQAAQRLDAQRFEKQTRLDELTGTTPSALPQALPARPPVQDNPPARTEPSDTPARVRRAPRKSRRQRVLDKLSGPMETVLHTSYKTFFFIGLAVALWQFFAFNHDNSLDDGVAYKVLPLYILLYCSISLLIGWLLKRYIRKELDSQRARTESETDANQQS